MLYIFRFLHQTTTIRNIQSKKTRLYIFRFLHQTTTTLLLVKMFIRCISFVSYIKPQPRSVVTFGTKVVYLSFPTSNHNWLCFCHVSISVVYLSFPTSNHNVSITHSRKAVLYIFRFLHQTTTCAAASSCTGSCISFVSYIKPQLFSLIFEIL